MPSLHIVILHAHKGNRGLTQNWLRNQGQVKTHLATALRVEACGQGHRVLYAPATTWVNCLIASYQAGTLAKNFAKLRRYPLLVVDEIGCIPFETEAANLFFQVFSSRYEHASLILTSNLPFSGWGEVIGNHMVASAMIDRIAHHAEVITLKSNSYRLRKHKDDTSQRKERERERGKITTATVVLISLRQMIHL